MRGEGRGERTGAGAVRAEGRGEREERTGDGSVRGEGRGQDRG